MNKSAERTAFEEWADDGFALTLIWDEEAGEYCNPTIQAEWEAWNTAWLLSAIHQAKQPPAIEQASAPASEPAVPEGYAKAYLPVSDEARLKALPQCISGPCTIEEAPERTHWEVYTPYCMVLAPNEHAADYIAGNLNMLFAVLNDPMTFTKSA